MATWYVNSAASGSGAGTSWANACTTIAAAIAKMAAGDDIDVASTHNESNSASVTWTFPGTAASPNRVFSCDTTNSPAGGSDLLSGAKVAGGASSAGQFSISGYVYIYGVAITLGASTNSSAFNLGNVSIGEITLDTCSIKFAETGAAALTIGTSSDPACKINLINTTLTFAATTQSIKLQAGSLFWRDTASALGGSTFPTTLFADAADTLGALITLDGVDLSALGSGNTIFTGSYLGPVVATLKNCKLGSSVTVAGAPAAPGGPFVDLINSDSAATGYRQERYRYQGTLTTETTVVRTGGANDGDTTISWKIVTTANAKRQSPFESFEIVRWFAAGAHTATFEVITDNVVLTNADLWVEAQYLGNSSYPISSLATTAPANQLTAGSNLTTSSATWTTTGLTTPKPQSAQVSFTSDLDGYVRFVFKVAKASTTVRIDPSPSAVS